MLAFVAAIALLIASGLFVYHKPRRTHNISILTSGRLQGEGKLKTPMANLAQLTQNYTEMHSVKPAMINKKKLGELLPLQYNLIQENGRSFHGQRNFTTNRKYLRNLGLPMSNFTTLDNITGREIVLVAGASGNHFNEVQDVVAGAQELFSQYTMYFVDFGLPNNRVAQVKTWCGVTYMKFNFGRYPSHVKNMRYYAWKVLIVMEILQKHPNAGVLWMDSSVRFRTGDIQWAIRMAQRQWRNGALHPPKPQHHFCNPS